MIRLVAGQLNNPQEMTVVVSGPGNANRLILCAGEALPQSTVYNNNYQGQTYSFLVGPVFQQGQMVRAIASAAVTRFSIGGQFPAGGSLSANWSIVWADADWDDESGQVEVRAEIQLNTGLNQSIVLAGFSYNVSILAALPAN